MKKIIAAVTLGIGLFCLTTPANATLIYYLGGCDFSADSGGSGSCGGSGADLPGDALKMTFMNNGANKVRLTIDSANMPTNTAKINDIWFNVDSGLAFGDLSFTYLSGVAADNIIAGGNVSSAGIFDIDFQYKTSGPMGDFYYGMTSVYDITGTGLTENNFADLSSNGVAAAFHLNITGNGNSGHYAAVPIPSSILLIGTGLAGLIGISTRKKKKEA